ncbi:DEAD/DEAH box helicase [Azospirillum picis]|uniref:Transcription-repair-coupling factor n=1 Tax=Azospirillum picis TaxID=488438 RepID=A0ABU0MH50_9PROT|nr:DEAD/DEAH box helicase [Azospirillum picis]MBP2299001.1 transcription-repair coupling factor (superfamily II helicase) [Azospirillum picis]MDQ0532757.1 transcription-repair coupling factor (superfamily II helicase) [Azospirillum picis]
MLDGAPVAVLSPDHPALPDVLTVRSEGELAVRLASLARRPGGLLMLARSDGRAARLARLAGDLAPSLEVILLPIDETAAGDRAAPSRSVLGRRAAGLMALAEGYGRERPGGLLVVASADLALQRLPPSENWRDGRFRLTEGMRFDEAAWRGWFARTGYVLDDRVDEPGEVAIRGAVVEVFPGDGDLPVRCDIADGVVRDLRLYDPVSQRSIAAIEEVTLSPVTDLVTSPGVLDRLATKLALLGTTFPTELREAVEEGRRPYGFDLQLPNAFDECPLLLDLLPNAAVMLDAGAGDRIEARIADLSVADLATDGLQRRLRGGVSTDLPVPAIERRLIDAATLDAMLAARRTASVEFVQDGKADAVSEPARTERTLLRRAGALLAEGAPVLLAAAGREEAKRLAGRADRGLGREVTLLDRWPEAPLPGGSCAVMALWSAEGFVCDGMTVLVAPRHGEENAGEAAARAPLAPSELAPGDFVVHLDYGIGRLVGLETVDGDGAAADFLVLEYAHDDRLLVPTADFDRLWRHGSSDSGARLDSLKNAGWLDRRAALEAEIAETAKGMMRAARQRLREVAPAVDPPADRMRRFGARFGFDPTEGQRRAIHAVLDAMRQGHPMDHLVCADVGYGKTEVALRAAASAAFCGLQVAVLAPTSVLARQHLDVFRRRFAGFGVRIEPLTGAMPKADQERVRGGLADGSVGIVIGTHALLSKTVRFHRLGLMVVDEEQRFGAAQKQALRRRTRGAHCLALSATPIPRTLQGALAGLRGLSIIDTPPARRRPVRTAVMPRDASTARAALLRELGRGGQAFCVTPRIADLKELEAWVRTLVPHARISVAHGRLGAAALDDAVIDFVDGRSDILVATPIIESGIDIPRANTMLLFRPDLFGLGQLHQLRGRVGRGAVQGYAYMLTDPEHPLEEQATRRLGSLEVIESLGGGFVLSMLDLDQRGAGDLLGEDQSGHLRAVGTELYQRILADALSRLRRQPDRRWEPEVTVAVPHCIPASYIPEEELRIGLHRRIARSSEAGDLDALYEEVEDRFGPLPEPVERLLAIAALRCRCRALGIATLGAGPSGVALTLHSAGSDPRRAERRAATLAKRSGGLLRAQEDRLSAALEAADGGARLANALRVLDCVEEIVRKAQRRKRSG